MSEFVRLGAVEDAEALLGVLVAAFMDDPVFHWFDPEPAARRRRREAA